MDLRLPSTNIVKGLTTQPFVEFIEFKEMHKEPTVVE